MAAAALRATHPAAGSVRLSMVERKIAFHPQASPSTRYIARYIAEFDRYDALRQLGPPKLSFEVTLLWLSLDTGSRGETLARAMAMDACWFA